MAKTATQSQRFRDRAHAGRLLAERLRDYAGRDDVIVPGLPRGGVPVAYEIASTLDAPLDVFLVCKLGVPGHEAYALGAIATGGIRILNTSVIESLKRLIAEAGFTAVAVEADWPDAYRVNRFVRGASDDMTAEQALADFRRFPSGCGATSRWRSSSRCCASEWEAGELPETYPWGV